MTKFTVFLLFKISLRSILESFYGIECVKYLINRSDLLEIIKSTIADPLDLYV